MLSMETQTPSWSTLTATTLMLSIKLAIRLAYTWLLQSSNIAYTCTSEITKAYLNMYIFRRNKGHTFIKDFVKEWQVNMIDVKCTCLYGWKENIAIDGFLILRSCQRLLHYIWLNVDRWSLKWTSCTSCWRSTLTECSSPCCCWRKRNMLPSVSRKDQTENTWSTRNWKGWTSSAGTGVT